MSETRHEDGRDRLRYHTRVILLCPPRARIGSYASTKAVSRLPLRRLNSTAITVTLLGQFTAASSQFLNKRGIYLGRRSTKIHVALYRWSRGQVGGHLPGWPDARIVLVDHAGAKSGRRRTSPLMYHATGDVIAVVASKAGQPTHPAWFHNLKAHPDTTIQIGSVTRNVRARVATDDERDRLWPQFVGFYPGYDFFQRNAKGRTIPIVILDPR